VEQELRERLAGIKGHAIERKRFSIALHYRQVANDDIRKLEPILDRVLTDHQNLCRGYGKKVFELKPDIDWNKGYAVLWLLERLGLDRPEVVPLYIGARGRSIAISPTGRAARRRRAFISASKCAPTSCISTPRFPTTLGG
jgi:trehalose-phosphatase